MASLSKKTQKVIYLNLKNSQNPQDSHKKEKHFTQELKKITGLSFTEFYDLLAQSTLVLAEAYGLFGRENYLETAEKLGSINMKLAEFASKSNFPTF